MGNWEKQQEDKRAGLERDRSRRENLGKFFYDLAKLTFAGLVIGGIVSFSPDFENVNTLYRVFFGGISTVLFARIGNKILK